MSSLFLENIEDVGDLFLDIAEAYAETGMNIWHKKISFFFCLFIVDCN